MSDEPQAMGGNAEAELKRRIERRIKLLDDVAELQEEMKGFKSEDKSDGFTEAAIANAVKMRRAGADKVLATLMLEAEIEVYRKAAGVPTEIEAAQEVAAAEAEAIPEPKERRRRADIEDMD